MLHRMLLLLLLLAGRLLGAGCDDSSVRIVEDRRNDTIHLFVESTNCLDVTITLTGDLQNMAASPSLPLTVETKGRRSVELVQFHSIVPSDAWHYHYHYDWRYGGRDGRPDGTVYELPFEGSAHHRLIQGYRGGFSHWAGSPNENAHDWDLQPNSLVQAARAGIVVGVRQDSNTGGASETFKNCANYVIIRHSDGTYGEYLHLQQNGVRVKLGDKVTAGQSIALSGNTGWSSRPHLHFAVFRAIDGLTRETLPVQFRTKDGSVQSLQEGKTY